MVDRTTSGHVHEAASLVFAWSRAVRQFGARRISPALLLAGTIAFLSFSNLLLWRFLGFAPWWLYAFGACLALTICIWIARRADRLDEGAPTVFRLLVCAAVSLLLYLLGGEGRFFFANLDWQVRDAVLRDLVLNPWPFVYPGGGAPARGGTAEILRAPIGMFLLPALVGKAGDVAAAELALLVQNTLFLTALLGLASILFPSARARGVALAVFILFSGMDIFGQLWMHLRHGLPVKDHLEAWADGLQYTAHITQAFWVPQHALSGWWGALLFLLWKAGRSPIGTFLAIVPLLALWSPLSLLGLIPFALWAGSSVLLSRKLSIADFALPFATTLLSLPSLLYLTAASDSVGLRLNSVALDQYIFFISLEVLPYLALTLALGFRSRFGGWVAMVTCGSLILIPFAQIGHSIDFVMRASIPALAILSIQVADILVRTGHERASLTGRAALLLILLAGSVTGLMEIRRSLANPPSPAPRCSFRAAYDQSFFAAFPKSTYLAPVAELPRAIRPVGASVEPGRDPERCWDQDWIIPANLTPRPRTDG